MHVQYVALCDQVIIGADGRPSLIGVFNDLQAPSMPVTLPRIAFVARLLFTPEEANKKCTVEVRLTDPNGVDLGRPGGELQLPPVPTGADSIAVDVPLQFELFQIDAFGRYTFLLHVDGKASAAVQLSVRKGGQAQPQPG